MKTLHEGDVYVNYISPVERCLSVNCEISLQYSTLKTHVEITFGAVLVGVIANGCNVLIDK